MRGEEPGDIWLREGGGRAQDQLSIADSFGDVGGHQRQLYVVLAIVVPYEDAGAGGTMCFDLLCIAAPQPDLMP
jgi:hypothetical protein